MMKPILLYTTFANIQDAHCTATTLISEGLAACVNLLDGVESHYLWEGVMEQSNEVVAIIKTSSQTQAKAMKRLAELHPYEVPCILAIPVEDGYAPYISWLLNGSSGTK